MIDIHCHILPYVDDGAGSMDDALEMARMAAESGVKTIIATPHCNLPGAQEKNYVSKPLQQRFIELRNGISSAGIPLTVLPGAEILCTPDVPELIQEEKLLTLAGSDYLLVEFFFDEGLAYMDDMLAAIRAEGLTPIIAHPERYRAVQEMPGVIERWFRSGIVIQLNKGSILGRLGRSAEICADWILSRGLAHLAASDAHSPEIRTPHMHRLMQHLEDEYSPEYTDILLRRNPSRICENRKMLRAD